MEVWLHQEYRQFGRLRKAGETVSLRDQVAIGLVARGAACPVVDGEHQCQLLARSEIESSTQVTVEGYLDEELYPSAGINVAGYLDEQMATPVNEMMQPVKWSFQKQQKMRKAAQRSHKVRELMRGKRFEDIRPTGIW